tara:strand:+ start:1119 stop:1436 length:318 start_codon:yes stop_codon:yes gene_type:complete
MKYNTTQVTWWIAHGMGDKIHSGVLPEGEQLRTGQPNFETFDNRRDWEDRLLVLENNPELYDEKEEELIDPNELDEVLYMDQIDHLLYGDKEFRHVANPYRREDT